MLFRSEQPGTVAKASLSAQTPVIVGPVKPTSTFKRRGRKVSDKSSDVGKGLAGEKRGAAPMELDEIAANLNKKQKKVTEKANQTNIVGLAFQSRAPQ